MNLISTTLNYLCLFFLVFLMIIYASKKKRMTVENGFYIVIMLSDLFIIVFELLFLYFSVYFKDNIFLIGLFERLSSVCLNIFFIFIFLYATFICVENNVEFTQKISKNKKKIYSTVAVVILLIIIFEIILPLNYHYNKNGIIDYVYGPALDGVAIVNAVVLFSIFIPLLKTNWKDIDKKKLSPLLVATILEVITLIVSGIAPTICLAPVSLTATCYLMYMTIENPDLKLIKELELAKNQAEKSNNAKSDFLSSMSHELRTPLNAIVGLSQMIQSTTNEEETKNDIDDILKASKNLLELVDGILDINKLEANEMEIVKSNYNPKEIIDDLDRMIKIRIDDKPIELRTRVSDLPLTLSGDKDKIKRIMLNILTNAVKYTDTGYIDFVVDSVIVKDKCNLRISISDTGRGIPESQMESLFTKFNRREEDKDSDIEGTGLGLAITKSLVDLMEGKITVNSTEGMGSTFLVVIAQDLVDQPTNDVEVL